MTLLIVLLILIITFSLYCKVLFLNSFDGLRSDAKKQLDVASKYKDWGKWTSNMHNNFDKSAMKDVGVFLLAIVKNYLNFSNSFFNVIFVSTTGKILSCLLVFLISSLFLDPFLSFLIFLLYIFSFWSFMICSHGGFQTLATFLFLLALYFFLLADSGFSFVNFFLFFFSGVFFTLMNFASASARKYNIPFFFFVIIFYDIDSFIKIYLSIFDLYLLLITFFYLIFIYLVYLKPKFLSYLINIFFFKNFSNIKEIKDIKELSKILFKFSLTTLLIFISIILFLPDYYLFNFSIFFIGSIMMLIYLLAPNFYKNMRLYIFYWYGERDQGTHYRLYKDYFLQKYNKIFIRGKEGLIWYVYFYFRMMPFEILFLSLITVLNIYHNSSMLYFANLIFILLICITPIIFSELTFGNKSSLPLYTTLVNFYITKIILIYFLLSSGFGYLNTFYLTLLFCIIIILRNFYIIIYDILPSRTTIKLIYKFLKNKKIFKLYTFDTKFNKPFADVLKDYSNNHINFTYVKSISEIKSGYFFLPCTNIISPYYQSNAVGIKPDIDLNEIFNIIESSKEKYFFKSIGSSKYWQLISNVSAFRYLILNEKPDFDFQKFAWIIKI